MVEKTVRVVAAEIELDGKYLITQRRPEAILPLLWEFPSGKVEEGESDSEALRREIQERLGAEIEVAELSMFIKHEYETYALDFCVYRCTLISDSVSPVLAQKTQRMQALFQNLDPQFQNQSKFRRSKKGVGLDLYLSFLWGAGI